MLRCRAGTGPTPIGSRRGRVVPTFLNQETWSRNDIRTTVVGILAIAILLFGAFITRRRKKKFDLAKMFFPAGKLTTFDKVLLGVTAVPVTILVGGILGAWMFL